MLLNDITQEIQSKLDIIEVIGEYLPLKKAGTNYISHCPFHNDKKTPSFSISQEKGLFYCFGCQKGGNIFHFLMEYKKLTFYDSLLELGKRAGVDITKQEKNSNESILEIYKESSKSYIKALAYNAKVQEYLKSRGIVHGIKVFKLGYAPNESNYLQKELSKSYSIEELQKSDIIRRGEYGRLYDYFRNRLIFPIENEYGKIIAFGGRVLNTKDEPKYLNSKENYYFKKGQTLYGLNNSKQSIKELGYAIIVEGYTDVILSHEHGIKNVVAPLGTSLTQEHIIKLRRYALKVLLCFDGDEAGIKATNKSLKLLLGNGLEVMICPLPKGVDPSDYILEHGAKKFMEVIKKAPEGFKYYIKSNLRLINKDSVIEKRTYLDEVYSLLNGVESEVQKELYLKMLSDLLKVSYHSISADFKKQNSLRKGKATLYKSNTANVKRIEKESLKGANNARRKAKQGKEVELYLLYTILNNNELYSQYKNRLKAEYFKDEFTKNLYDKIYKMHVERGEIVLAELIKMFEGEEQKLLYEAVLKEDKKYQTESPIKAIEDCLINLRIREIKALKEKITTKLKRAQSKEETEELLEDKQFLVNEETKLKRGHFWKK